MDPLNEGETQLLISLVELAQPKETPNNNFYTFYPKTLDEAGKYFRGLRVDWTEAYASLIARGWVCREAAEYRLTPAGISAANQVREARPPIYYWYEEFYSSAPESPAYAEFCTQLYGLNLCQAGFSDMDQIERAIQVSQLAPGQKGLDLGCGAGHTAEYFSDRTGAKFTGVDYSPRAIAKALERTQAKRDLLDFLVGNLDELDLPAEAFDVILSVDTLYMPNHLDQTLQKMLSLLKPAGRLVMFYTSGIWDTPDRRELLLPENTPLGIALRRCGLEFQAQDFSAATHRLMQRKRQIGEALRSRFEAEGNQELYRFIIAESESSPEPYQAETSLTRRYLYTSTRPGDR